MNRSRILIVEDEALVAADIEQRLQRLGYHVTAVVDTGEDAVTWAGNWDPDLALMDIRLRGEMSGIEAAGILRDRHRIPVVYLTSHADPDTLARAAVTEPFGFIVKPFQEHDLHATIEMAFCRARAEERVRQMERWLSVTLNSIGDGVVATDLAGRVTFLNRVAEHLTGWSSSEAVGREMSDVVELHGQSGHSETMQLVAKAIELETVIPRDHGTVLLSRDGCRVPIDHTAAPIRDGAGIVIGAVFVFRDRTERDEMLEQRRRIEQKLQDTQKLESLGVLAGGIAHDFNNLLTGIMGNTSLAIEHLPRDSVVLEFLDGVRAASQRAADLIKQMLAYSGRGRYEIAIVDLSELVKETAKLIAMSVSKKAELRFSLDAGLPPVAIDAVQIRQVVMNLVINASESMDARSGVIHVSTSVGRVDGATLEAAVTGGDIPPGDYVTLEVRDTGSGISPEDLQRIFDPFFTTKFTGRGLGLAAVLGIIRSHKGALVVESELGVGTVFRIHLPAHPGLLAPAPDKGTGLARMQVSGTVLIIDDEPMVCQAARHILKAHGFAVDTAPDGPEGLQLFVRNPKRYAVVLLDLTMPHMNGLEVFTELRRIDPDVKIVLMSGYSEREAMSKFSDRGLAGFLPKPFDAAALFSRLKDVLA